MIRTVQLIRCELQQVPDEPLFRFDFAEPPTQLPQPDDVPDVRQHTPTNKWYCPFVCGCIGLVAWQRTMIRSFCAAHRPLPSLQPTVLDRCPRCLATASIVTTPAGRHCGACKATLETYRLD